MLQPYSSISSSSRSKGQLSCFRTRYSRTLADRPSISRNSTVDAYSPFRHCRRPELKAGQFLGLHLKSNSNELDLSFAQITSQQRLSGESFPFPSNGKAHGHTYAPRRFIRIPRINVSIPFKRESTRALCLAGCHTHSSTVSIPFKRESTCAPEDCRLSCNFIRFHVSIPFKTGKHMCTNVPGTRNKRTNESKFPFPSNGKAHVHEGVWQNADDIF